MNSATLTELGILLTRVTLGVAIIAHSLYLKLAVFTLGGTAQFFESIGLPGLLAYAVFAIEVTAGVALILGIQVRLAALALVPVLIGATWAHWSAGWLFTNSGGGWEYPAFMAAIAVAQVLLGPGALPVPGLRRAVGSAG